MEKENIKEEVKQLFKTVFEYSLYVEKEHQLLLKRINRQINDVEPADLNLNETILYSIFYDFIKKAITLNETKEMLINIVKQNGTELLLMPLTDDSFFQDDACFIIPELAQSAYITDVMKLLIQWVDDDEWAIRFFTDYISEILAVSKISKEIASLETEDWEQYLVSYLMGEVAGEVQIL